MPRSRPNSPFFGSISIENTNMKSRRQKSKYGNKKNYEKSKMNVYEEGFSLFGKPSPMEFRMALFRQRYDILAEWKTN
jgi:hypothetical protein